MRFANVPMNHWFWYNDHIYRKVSASSGLCLNAKIDFNDDIDVGYIGAALQFSAAADGWRVNTCQG